MKTILSVIFLLVLSTALLDGTVVPMVHGAGSDDGKGEEAPPAPDSGHGDPADDRLSLPGLKFPVRQPRLLLEEGLPHPQPHREVFDLFPNRHLAHLVREGGLAIHFGEPGAVRYLHGNLGNNWLLMQEVDGRRVAMINGTTATMQLPLSGRQAASADLSLALNLKGVAGQSVAPTFNGTALKRTELEAGWNTVQWRLPNGVAQEGENIVDLQFRNSYSWTGVRRRSAAPLHWLRLGETGAIDEDQIEDPESVDAPVPLEGRFSPAGKGPDAVGLALPPDGGLAYYLTIPPDAALELIFIAGGTGCTVNATAHGDGVGESRVALHPPYSPSADALEEATAERTFPVAIAGRPIHGRLDLTALGGRVARVEITAGPLCINPVLLRGSLTVPGTTPEPQRAPAPRNVVMFIIDTLRADRIRSINPETRIQSEGYDRIVKEGTTFAQTYSQGNESFVSHAAIFTGQYPQRSRITRAGNPLPPSIPLISQALKDLGMSTAGYTSNGYIARRNGYVRGWDQYINALGQNLAYLAPSLNQYAWRWLSGRDRQPFFMYMGPVDPHVTYRSRPDILPLYDPEPYSGPFTRVVTGHQLGRIKSGSMRVTERDKTRIIAIYDDEVHFTGDHLAKYMDWLEERDMLDDTMLIVTSDHGEEFWEHGSVGHGHSIWEEMVHVPLIIRYPALFPKGHAVHEGADTLDIFPTVLDVLGQDIPPELQGESLLPAAQGIISGYPRPSVSTHYTISYAMRLGRWKIISGPRGRRRIYDVFADPTEQKDLFGGHPAATRMLTDAMAFHLAYGDRWRKDTWGVPGNLKEGFNPFD